jgi:hypothetical protein
MSPLKRPYFFTAVMLDFSRKTPEPIQQLDGRFPCYGITAENGAQITKKHSCFSAEHRRISGDDVRWTCGLRMR